MRINAGLESGDRRRHRAGMRTAAAAALAQYLLKQRRGEKIREMIVVDVRTALARGDREHAHELFAALRHFLASHPQYCRANLPTG